jgi:hypothetical protein
LFTPIFGCLLGAVTYDARLLKGEGYIVTVVFVKAEVEDACLRLDWIGPNLLFLLFHLTGLPGSFPLTGKFECRIVSLAGFIQPWRLILHQK